MTLIKVFCNMGCYTVELKRRYQWGGGQNRGRENWKLRKQLACSKNSYNWFLVDYTNIGIVDKWCAVDHETCGAKIGMVNLFSNWYSLIFWMQTNCSNSWPQHAYGTQVVYWTNWPIPASYRWSLYFGWILLSRTVCDLSFSLIAKQCTILSSFSTAN
jgi:hypothetical protein